LPTPPLAGSRNSWPFVARTYLFDAAIERRVAEGFDTVLNLGAGLDTRPDRMALRSSVNWIEADLPAMIACKETMDSTGVLRPGVTGRSP
jgi:O-methyltransferase involved in polyketide biosynthesis